MSGFANPRPFDELSASNQRSIGKKTKRKLRILKPVHPRAESGMRAQIRQVNAWKSLKPQYEKTVGKKLRKDPAGKHSGQKKKA